MPPILFPDSTSPGLNTQESGGRLINAYAEGLGAGAPAQNVIRRAPGLGIFSAVGTETGYRGSILVEDTLYAAFSGTLISIDSDGVRTTVDTLAGTGPVYFARNNKTPTPDITMVTEIGWFSTDGATVTEITDIDLPQPNSITFADGFFFLTIQDGRCFASGINDTTIASTDYVRAEAKPDGLTRGIAYDRDLFLFGPTNCEVWTNTGNATGFPFSRTTIIWRGLISAQAIAGFEDGFATALLWVADDCRVHQLNGYATTVVSPPDLDRLLSDVTDKDTISAFVYVVGGRPCWCVKAPGFAWVYDLSAQRWHERQSYLSSDWRAEGNSVLAFGKWIVGDADTGNLLAIEADTRTEVSNPLVWEVESIAMGAFPSRLRIPRVDFNFVEGVGVNGAATDDDVNPQVEISWSDNRGVTWSTPILRNLGAEQDTGGRIAINRVGSTGVHGRRWRLKVAAGVYAGLLGGDMKIEQRPR